MKKKICKNCLHYDEDRCAVIAMEVTKQRKGCFLFQKYVNMDVTIITFLVIDVLDLIATIAFLIYYFWR